MLIEFLKPQSGGVCALVLDFPKPVIYLQIPSSTEGSQKGLWIT